MLLRRQPLAHEVLEPRLPVPSVRFINIMRIIHGSIVVVKGVVIIKFSGPGEILRLRILNLILVARCCEPTLCFSCPRHILGIQGCFSLKGGHKQFLAKKRHVKILGRN